MAYTLIPGSEVRYRSPGADAMGWIDQITDFLDSVDPRLLPWLTEVGHLALWLVVLSVIFAPLERLFALHPKKIFRKAVVTDIGYYFMNNLLITTLMSVPLALVALGAHRLVPAGFLAAMEGSPLWFRISAAMVVGETGLYWGHRWSHEIPLLWRFHAVHHSAEHIDFLVSSRAHPVDLVFSRVCQVVPMYVLGLASPTSRSGTLLPILVILFGTVWGFFIHANVTWRFGWLEWLVSTPAFHHWHHTNDGPQYINKNYAPTLPWIDKIFGTLYLPRDKHPERYGIDDATSPILVGQLVEPFMVWRKPAPPPQAAQAAQEAPHGAEAVSAPAVDPGGAIPQ
jgi:sterol desaturase/sphingolipid hydroxylase (fatty acid hydroxylase superfamily)